MLMCLIASLHVFLSLFLFFCLLLKIFVMTYISKVTHLYSMNIWMLSLKINIKLNNKEINLWKINTRKDKNKPGTVTESYLCNTIHLAISYCFDEALVYTRQHVFHESYHLSIVTIPCCCKSLCKLRGFSEICRWIDCFYSVHFATRKPSTKSFGLNNYTCRKQQ